MDGCLQKSAPILKKVPLHLARARSQSGADYTHVTVNCQPIFHPPRTETRCLKSQFRMASASVKPG